VPAPDELGDDGPAEHPGSSWYRNLHSDHLPDTRWAALLEGRCAPRECDIDLRKVT
jgi:hypothetical protein